MGGRGATATNDFKRGQLLSPEIVYTRLTFHKNIFGVTSELVLDISSCKISKIFF